MSLCGWEPRWTMPRGIIAASALLQFLVLFALRMLIRRIAGGRSERERGVIVAADLPGALALQHKFSQTPLPWLSIEGCLSAQEFLQRPIELIPWNTVLVAEQAGDKDALLRRASQLGKTIYVIPGALDLWMAGARPVEIDDLLVLRLSPPHLRPAQRALKRLFDVAGALCLLLPAVPAVLLAALAVRLSSAGPVLFRQTRVGANGCPYTLYKLRTMVANAEQATGPILAAEHDRRITRIGRCLRALRMDELPQLLNVLLGDMSLVGPRPERPHFVRLFGEHLPNYDLRLAVKPGITGLAQVYGRYSTTPEFKLRFDLMYIYNYSLIMDIQILFKTVLTVLQTSHARGLRPDSV